jgi:hypothetical protein
MCSSAISVPDGHIGLILLHEQHSSFYLQIPLDIIGSLCLKPRKYLLFLGWCILGVEGALALDRGGSRIDTDGVWITKGYTTMSQLQAQVRFLLFTTTCHSSAHFAHIACTHGDLCMLSDLTRRFFQRYRPRGHQGEVERAFGNHADARRLSHPFTGT